MIGTLAGLSLFATFWRRALIFGLLTLACVLLAFFPERYRAAATLTPTDPQSLGLSGTLGQLGAINSVFGNQAAVEVALRVTNSVLARNRVINELKLEQRTGKPPLELHRWLERKVTARSLRGGIILIEMQDRDSDLAQDIVAAYAQATQDRLADISRRQTAYKRDILVQLVDEASVRLSQAQAVYDRFRLSNQTPSPETAVEAVSYRIPALEGAIKAKQVQIASARQLFTDENPVVRQELAELAALQAQLAQVRMTSGLTNSTVGRAVSTSSQLYKLERDLALARSLYDSYLRFLQGTTVEDLTSTANVRMLEPPFVDTDRQVWWPLAAVAIAIFLLWLAIEFYRLRPPLGSQIASRTQEA